jgi:hypothetical protein
VGIVLRWWDLGGPTTSFDESFTAAYARLPVGDLFEGLRSSDAHPPLDYLVRKPFAMGDELWLRLPSALFATATLALVAWWMRERSWFGLAVTTLTALSAFQVAYAHTARMYALSILGGTVVVVAADRWLGGHRRGRWFAGGGLLVAALAQSAALFLVPGLLLLAGRRTDAEAWRWRATILAATALWGMAWGVQAFEQAERGTASWIPRTTPRSIVDALNGQVSLYASTAVIVTVLIVLGGAWLVRREPVLGKLWLSLFALPFLFACLAGLRDGFLLPRTIAFAAWGPVLALAACIEAARRLDPRAGLAAVAGVVIVVVPSVGPAATIEETLAGRPELTELARPGDAIVVHPRWLWPLMAWDHGATADEPRPAELDSLDGLDAFVFVLGDEPFSGRVWLYHPRSYPLELDGLDPCGPPLVVGDVSIDCYDIRDVTAPR